ncbi:family A G protein-coupled receptor-like protein [Cadophora sp. DSE1049]|nr:family A G protein-coupled receptor-like protein [Cadophora sp. DSE1049]
MTLLPRENDALKINPPLGADDHMSEHVSNFLWAVTSIYVASFFGCLIPSFTSHESKRVFNYILSMALLVGAITYFAQASDLGWSIVGSLDNTTHQVFYARYINWVVSFPALVLSLGILSGVSWTTIILNIFIAWFWVLSYFCAAYTTTDYYWGFFAFGTLAYIILAMSTLNESRESAQVIGISGDYMILAGWANVLWLLYPIAFGLGDGGGNVLGVNESFIFFGVLDVLLLPVASVGFLVLSRRWDFHKLQLDFSEYRGVRHGGRVSVETEELAVTGGMS